MAPWGNFAEFYQQGGAVMHPIVAAAAIGGVIVVERGWQLVVRHDTHARHLFAAIQCRILAGDTAAALRLCARNSPAARVMRAGLMAGVDRWRAEAAVKEEQMTVMPALTRWLPLLSSLATISLLLGLLGTTFGLIGGFHCGGTVSAAQRAAALSKSISLAIHTTGFGLMVAIPLLAARVWLQSRRDAQLADVALYGAKIVNLVTIATEPAPPRSVMPYRVSAPG